MFELTVGQPAEVNIQTLPALSLSAELDWIGPIPSPRSWFAPNDRYNAVQLELPASEETLAGIAVGTTAVCGIVVDDLRDVLQVQIQALFRNGSQAEVHPDCPEGPQRRTVVTGVSGESQVEIMESLAAGDTVQTGSQQWLQRMTGSLR